MFLLRVETTEDDGGIRPVTFALRARVFVVLDLIDRWHGEDNAYYKLVADDGSLYIIRHDLERDSWEMVMMEQIRQA